MSETEGQVPGHSTGDPAATDADTEAAMTSRAIQQYGPALGELGEAHELRYVREHMRGVDPALPASEIDRQP